MGRGERKGQFHKGRLAGGWLVAVVGGLVFVCLLSSLFGPLPTLPLLGSLPIERLCLWPLERSARPNATRSILPSSQITDAQTTCVDLGFERRAHSLPRARKTCKTPSFAVELACPGMALPGHWRTG